MTGGIGTQMGNVKREKAMDVYGRPAPYILDSLSKRQVAELDRYVGRVAAKVYTMAFDCGKQHAIGQIKRMLER